MKKVKSLWQKIKFVNLNSGRAIAAYPRQNIQEAKEHISNSSG